jgi:hypothetical protein
MCVIRACLGGFTRPPGLATLGLGPGCVPEGPKQSYG